MNEKKWQPVNTCVAIPIIMQVGISAQLIWGFFGNAWAISWLCPYICVIICLELGFYNTAVKKGSHPIKCLYPIAIMLGFAFFFTCGFMLQGWNWAWIGLAAAAVAVIVIIIIDKARKK